MVRRTNTSGNAPYFTVDSASGSSLSRCFGNSTAPLFQPLSYST